MKNTIIYLIGHYGVGKLTIAQAITRISGARLFDNHLANNVVFSLIRMDGQTPLPERVWDLIDTIRDQAVTAIAELAHPDESFVLTNVLFEGDRGDRDAYEQIEALAKTRRSLFVPVILTASDETFAIRLPTPEREARLKYTNIEGAFWKRRERTLLKIDHPNRLDLETSDLSPEDAANIILRHTRKLSAV